VTVYSWEEFIEQEELRDQPAALTVGVFDGIHVGHRRLIDLVQAHSDAVLRGVITFSENPSAIVHRSSYLGDILSVRQRLERLERLGVHMVVLIDFSRAFRALPGRRFLDLVRRSVNLRYLTVGWNFHCGHNSDTSAAEAAEYLGERGVRVDIAEPVVDNGVPVSSTRIRREIGRGALEDAERLMTERWALDLRGIDADCVDSRCLLRREEIRQVLPPAGWYDRPLLLDSGVRHNQFEVTNDGVRWMPLRIPSPRTANERIGE
jgi:riboflavin kinase/FMN adenylyltransferase